MTTKEMNINIIPAHEDIVIPEYAHVGDAGFDLRADLINKGGELVIEPGEVVLVPTGLKFEIPVGYELQLRPRSGLTLKQQLRPANTPGTIDSNFQGEVMVILENFGTTYRTVEHGDRICQGVVVAHETVKFNVVEEFNGETDRGENGFGSSGVK